MLICVFCPLTRKWLSVVPEVSGSPALSPFPSPRLLPQLSQPFSPGVSFSIQINCHRFCSVLDLPPFLGEPNTPLALDSIWVSLAGSQSLRAGAWGTQSNLHICFPPPSQIKMLSCQKPHVLLPAFVIDKTLKTETCRCDVGMAMLGCPLLIHV